MNESPTLELAKETDVKESSRNAGGAGKLPACRSSEKRYHKNPASSSKGKNNEKVARI